MYLPITHTVSLKSYPPLRTPLSNKGFIAKLRETNGTSFVSRFRSSFLEVQMVHLVMDSRQVLKTMGGSLFCVVQDNYGMIYTMIHI